MDSSQRKEQFGYGYLLTTATAACCWLSEPRVDIDSIDCQIRARGRAGRFSSPCLDVQLKCTVRDGPLPDDIPFDLIRKNYEDLRDPGRYLQAILAVLFLPADDGRWLEYPERSWLGRYDCYWINLRGCAPMEGVGDKKRIHIPRQQRLTATGLDELMTSLSRRRYL